MKPVISIIVPFRNEEAVIKSTILNLEKSVQTPHEIVCVDDGIDPSDKTINVIRPLLRTYKRIRIIPKTASDTDGFGSALVRGVKNAGGNIIVFIMADMCDDAGDIDRMYACIKKGFDVVSGSRYVDGGGKSGGPALQGFFSTIFGKSIHLLTGIPTHDITNSFKMYRKEILENITFDRAAGVEISIDLCLQAYGNGAKMTEIPTIWKGRTKGSSKFKLLERIPRYARLYAKALSSSNRSGINPQQ